MLKQHATFYRQIMIGTDAVIAGACFFLAYYLGQMTTRLFPIEAYLWILPVVVALWSWLLYFSGMYASFRLKSLGDIIFIILRAAFLGFFIFGSIMFIFKATFVSRAFVILIFALTAYFITLEKVVLIVMFRHLRRKGYNFRNILIVGTGPRAQRFMAEVDVHRELGLKIAGIVDDEFETGPKEILGHKVIGYLRDIPKIIREHAVDIVVFIVPRSWLARIEEPILYCETVGISASIAVDFFDLQFATGRESHLFGFPFLTFERTTHKIPALFVKRLIDIFLSGIGLIILCPLFAFIAVFVKTTTAGPVFFRQKRSGLNGRTFLIYKFRTMVSDAEAQLESLRRHNLMEGPAFKVENDPRVTRAGRFLRKFSLDELPQLWNVFKGDMSLVGPRPPLLQEVKQYDHWQRRKLSMRPGITCLWQISGRNNIRDVNEWMKLDLEYIDHWSLWSDLSILLRTIPVVLLGYGAK